MRGSLWRAEDGRKGRECFRRAASGRRKGRFCIWWHGGWLEAMNGDCILFWTYLKEEGMRGAAEDFIRTRVGRGEGRVGRRGSDECIGGVEEG
jgi:hypothetical protein